MSETQEATKTNGGAVAQPAQSMGEVVPHIGRERLAYHPLVQERFGIDRAAWRALTDAVFPSAKTTEAVILALSYCRARNLDPFKRVVHIVPVWDNDKGQYVETVWPGIAEHRTTAFRTKQYAGAEAAQFGDNQTKVFSGTTKKGGNINVSVTYPTWCQLTVYRMIDGQRVPVPGPRVYWLETYSKMGRTEVPNDRWQRAPFQMIEKCAEAAALRRAFPEELGGEVTTDEVGAIGAGPGDDAVDVTPPARPTRKEFTGDPAAAGHEDLDSKFRQTMGDTPHDPETGEVIEQQTESAEGTSAAPADAPAAGAPPANSTALAEATADKAGAVPNAESAPAAEPKPEPQQQQAPQAQQKPAPAQRQAAPAKKREPAMEAETTTEAVYRNVLKWIEFMETKAALDTFWATDKRVAALRTNNMDLYDLAAEKKNERLRVIAKAAK